MDNAEQIAREIFEKLWRSGFFTDEYGWVTEKALKRISYHIPCAGLISGMKEGVTGLGLLTHFKCNDPENKGKPVLGIAVVNGEIEIKSFPAGECPWLIHEADKPKSRWPEGYEEYGVFVTRQGLYVREELTGLTKLHFIPKGDDAPEGYRLACCFLTTSRELWLPNFPSWVKTKVYEDWFGDQ
jgi:hypothetical protein